MRATLAFCLRKPLTPRLSPTSLLHQPNLLTQAMRPPLFITKPLTYGGGVTYGADVDAETPDFSVYPFAIVSYGDSQTNEIINQVYSKDAGEHTIKVTVLTSEEPEGDLPCEYPSITINLVPEPRYGGVLVVTAIDGKLNATWNHINNAYQNGLVTILGEGLVTGVSEFTVTATNTYTADSANGYPTL